jgi:hypothetical protein
MLRDHEAKYGKLTMQEVLSIPNPGGSWANIIEYFHQPEAWQKRKKEHNDRQRKSD